MDLPELNKRIKKIIDNQTNGVVKKFAENVNLPQQTINRLFIIDKRTGKYPIATTEILQKISEMYDCISPEWLLTGKGEMLRGVGDNIAMVSEKTENSNITSLISILNDTLKEKDKQIDRLLSIIEKYK